MFLPLLVALVASFSVQPVARGQPYELDIDISKYTLLSTVLVATVDGKFHALNRTSGHTIWSMSSLNMTTNASVISPLVCQSYSEAPDEEEIYIVEPQSGDIFVQHCPTCPLQRFPFSIPELVDHSPFTSTNKTSQTVFLVWKETSFLMIDLETGNSSTVPKNECPQIPGNVNKNPQSGLDKLKVSRIPVSGITHVCISRTDYIMSIHETSEPGTPAFSKQVLGFSQYNGPNSILDTQQQSAYQGASDGVSIQPLASGEIIAFNVSKQSEPEEDQLAIWANRFSSPTVAVFDVFKPSYPSLVDLHTFVLLQPRLRLQDLFPELNTPSVFPGRLLQNPNLVKIGEAEDSGSLFVMSSEQYPLVIFASGKHKLREVESS